MRSALRDALAAPLLPTLGPAALGPFVPLLMAHVCSAMTHLAEPIRCAVGMWFGFGYHLPPPAAF